LKSFDVLLLIPLENTNINIIIWGRLCWVRWGLSCGSPEPEAGSFESLDTLTKCKELKKTLTWTKGTELKTLIWIFQKLRTAYMKYYSFHVT
jgi:hypothetical protein